MFLNTQFTAGNWTDTQLVACLLEVGEDNKSSSCRHGNGPQSLILDLSVTDILMEAFVTYYQPFYSAFPPHKPQKFLFCSYFYVQVISIKDLHEG